jgi:outer membrane scaffolding protein for murein synthesis (MipA/OmpV family)
MLRNGAPQFFSILPTALARVAALAMLALALPAAAQDQSPMDGPPMQGPPPDFVPSGGGEFLAVGLGVAVSSTYSGSDNYDFTVLPVVLGSVGGVRINPRGGGLALDFVRDAPDGIGLDAGVSARLRSDRVGDTGDEVVNRLAELDRAIEIGPTVGIRFPGLLNRFDSLTLNADILWDVAGAHGGMVIAPNLQYSTPLGRGVFANFTLGTEYADAGFQDYYFRISPADALTTGLPTYEPGGGGFTGASATLLLAIDLDGNLTNGGWSLVTLAGYSRVLGDAANTPFTTIRGTPNQFLGALGIGYSF